MSFTRVSQEHLQAWPVHPWQSGQTNQKGTNAMTNISNENIKRRADGSIDTDFYLTIGRYARSEQAHHMLSAGSRPTIKLMSFVLKVAKQVLRKKERNFENSLNQI